MRVWVALMAPEPGITTGKASNARRRNGIWIVPQRYYRHLRGAGEARQGYLRATGGGAFVQFSYTKTPAGGRGFGGVFSMTASGVIGLGRRRCWGSPGPRHWRPQAVTQAQGLPGHWPEFDPRAEQLAGRESVGFAATAFSRYPAASVFFPSCNFSQAEHTLGRCCSADRSSPRFFRKRIERIGPFLLFLFHGAHEDLCVHIAWIGAEHDAFRPPRPSDSTHW